MAMLKDRPTGLIEVVISCTDAWDLSTSVTWSRNTSPASS
jgi:hypothetical protein